MYLLQTGEVCRRQAQEMGLATSEVMNLLLARETNRNLRKAQKLLRLDARYGVERLEAVCGQALEYQTLKMSFFEGALQQPVTPGLEAEISLPVAPGFLRPGEYFSHG